MDSGSKILWLIESETPEQDAALDACLLPVGYQRVLNLGFNRVYTTEPEVMSRIQRRVYEIDLVHTCHPLDRGEDTEVRVSVDLR